MKKTIVIILVILTILICSILLFNTNVEVEYVPETEIEEVDLRKTMITLYYLNKDNMEIQKESRLIDSKDLLLDPYEELINMLIEGPESEFLCKAIPGGTRLLSTKLVGDCLNIDFSKEFLQNGEMSEEKMEKIICSIQSTLTELNEVNSIKITIEGNEVL